MHLVLVNQFFPPSRAPTGRLLRDLAVELASRRHRVSVITSATIYGDSGEAGIADPDGVSVHRLGGAGSHRSGLVGKLSDYASFYRQASRLFSRLDPAPDGALFMTTPPMIGLVGAGLIRKNVVPYVLWCMDLYPEALAAHGLLRRWNPVHGLLHNLARRERRNASRVVVLGPDMARLVQADAPDRVIQIPVWSDIRLDGRVEDDARNLRRQRGWADDEVVMLYSGNMGRAHRIDEIAQLAERLRGSSARCRVVMAGSGPNLASWRQRYGSIFEFMPPAPTESLAAHLRSADIHLVTQQPEWTGVVVPSKFQAACASGRPVIYNGPGDSAVAAWINECDTGWVIPPGDEGAVAKTAREVLDGVAIRVKGEKARALFLDRFTRERNCAALADLLEHVSGV